MYKHLFIVILLFINSTLIFSQSIDIIDPMPLKLRGQVLSLDDESPIQYGFVQNLRTKIGITTDDQGRFLMDILNIDSLAVTSLGFTKTIVHIPVNHNEKNVLIIYARPVRFAIPEVSVHGEQQKVNMEGIPSGKKNDIDPHLRGDSYSSKPPVIAAFFTPLSFIQYYTSKSEREKRETRKAIITEKRWAVLSQFYNKELVMQLTGLNDNQADDFMIYINTKGLLSQMANEYDVRNIINQQFVIYRNEGN